MARKNNVKTIVTDLTNDFLSDTDTELYNVEFKKEGRDWYLKVFIEKKMDAEEKYIGTTDCENVSRYLSEKLDELDVIEQNYYLELSSPGMDRELIFDKDFERFKGENVEVKLYQAIDGSKEISGELVGLRNDEVVIMVLDKEIILPRDKVAKINLAIAF
ncbi:MAG: ribosome maturation factor RimP [Peptostreptococcaceae bacterium]|nr:ribosome maturation factor RimP [Peptostreptococcaceae bacterium]